MQLEAGCKAYQRRGRICWSQSEPPCLASPQHVESTGPQCHKVVPDASQASKCLLNSALVPRAQVWDLGSWGSQAYYPTTNPVDIPDSVYVARFSSPVTVTPFYSWCVCVWVCVCVSVCVCVCLCVCVCVCVVGVC